MQPDEARAAAAAEGLELVLSSTSATGFRCVRKHFGNYQVEIKENFKRRHLGIFATPEEAALCYARHIGAERAAAVAEEARGEGSAERVAADAAQARHTRHTRQGKPVLPSSAAKVRRTNPRDAFTADQKLILCEVFAHTARPSDEQMQELSEQLGLTARQVQIWFQNRRTRFGSPSAPESTDVPRRTEAAEASVERRPHLAAGEARAAAAEGRAAAADEARAAAAAEARAVALPASLADRDLQVRTKQIIQF